MVFVRKLRDHKSWGLGLFRLRLIAYLGLVLISACGRMRFADFETRGASVALSLPSATPPSSPTATPTPYAGFGLPVKKVEVLVGDDSPVFRGLDLSGLNTGVATSVPNPSALPPGLVYNPSEGSITGAPTTPGDYPFDVCYVDQAGNVSTCTGVLYSILAEPPIALASQRPSAVPDGTCSSSSGVGSLDNPIRLSTPTDLNTCVRNYPRAAFRLMNDIGLGSFPGTTPGNSFNPLPFFYGNFDGAHFRIHDWNWSLSTAGISYPGSGGATNLHFNGLFRGIAMGAVVKHLVLESVTIDTGMIDTPPYSSANGILAGFLRGGVVVDVSVVTSQLYCARRCGGLIGAVYNPRKVNPFPEDPSTDYRDGYLNRIGMNSVLLASNANYSNLGGFVGEYNAPFRISRATAVAMSITSGNSVGGIAGSHLLAGAAATSVTDDSRFWLDRCSVEGVVGEFPGNSAAFMGGLIGFMRGNDTITDSYARVDLDSTDVYLGGLVGNLEPSLNNEKSAIIAYSYFGGTVSGPSTDRGLLIGGNNGAWNGSFTGDHGIHLVHNKFEQDLNYAAIGSAATATINVLNNSNQIFTQLPGDWSNPSNYPGWLSSIWMMTGSYPALQP
jgi:hypothetical protein